MAAGGRKEGAGKRGDATTAGDRSRGSGTKKEQGGGQRLGGRKARGENRGAGGGNKARKKSGKEGGKRGKTRIAGGGAEEGANKARGGRGENGQGGRGGGKQGGGGGGQWPALRRGAEQSQAATEGRGGGANRQAREGRANPWNCTVGQAGAYQRENEWDRRSQLGRSGEGGGEPTGLRRQEQTHLLYGVPSEGYQPKNDGERRQRGPKWGRGGGDRAADGRRITNPRQDGGASGATGTSSEAQGANPRAGRWLPGSANRR